ncbi:hypothetical protein [Streptacidiphilus albus]|uniref:hypothetical protein n=1 Tax=Streptacidiphilus albus TaxID=105425 RepID=UPI00054B65A5|nr:hypothetical protein [Streptacidiphilus albus]
MSTTADKKALRASIRALHARIQVWSLRKPGLHFDQAIVCPSQPARCGSPECEGCGITAMRTERLERFRAELRPLEAELRRLDGKPEPAPKPKPVAKAAAPKPPTIPGQTPLFA